MAIITISRGSLSGGRRLGALRGHEPRLRGHQPRGAGPGGGPGVRRDGAEPAAWPRERAALLGPFPGRSSHLSRRRPGDAVPAGRPGQRRLPRPRRPPAPARRDQRAPSAHHPAAQGAHPLRGQGARPREAEAEAHIRKRDEERVSWTRFLYGIEWADPDLYDVTLNLERSPSRAPAACWRAWSSGPSSASTEQNRRQLADLGLAAHAHAKLFLNPKISAAAAKLEVKADSRASCTCRECWPARSCSRKS